MYSPRSIEAGLKVAERELGFEPIYHSVEACDEAVEHFNTRLDKHVVEYGDDWEKSGKPRPLYDEDEIRWIQNERKLCMVDYLYYASRYGWILAEDEMVHYNPNIAQLIVNDSRADLEDRGWVILEMILKARQVGITTDSQMVISQRTFFVENTVALTGSSDKDRSREMVEKYVAIYDALPFWLKPKRTTNRTGTRTAFDNMGSRLIVQHGSQKFDIGRGNTPSCFHLSEVSTYTNTADLIDAGLMPAFHENPRKIGILESTGEGPFGWWYDTWEHCKRRYWDGLANFRPVFLPWFVARDFYPTTTWIKRSPVPEGWVPDAVVIGHAERAKRFVRMNDLLRKYYPENWEMPIEQMWFWWVTREQYKAKKKLDRFMHEFAADDLEAFAASGESVFDIDTLDDYNQNCLEPVGVFGFRASEHTIPPRLQADVRQQDMSKPVIPIGPYELVPLKWEGWQTSSPEGRLLVFEWPESAEEYGFGIDTSDGVGQDNTIIEGLRKGSLLRNDAQVCEFASPYINANDLAPIAHAVALFFQQAGMKQPKIAIEVGLNGESTQLELRKLGWSNFHNWQRYDRKKLDPRHSERLGWVTNRWSRAMLIDYTIKALRDGDIDINSPEFVKEMQSLHRDEDMQSARAEWGKHDDRFMALGIIYISMHILELTGKQKSISYMRQQRANQGTPMYREQYVGSDETLLIGAGKTALPGPKLAQFFAPTIWHPGQVEGNWEGDL